MRIAALEMPLRFGAVEAALELVDQALAEAEGLDLVLLPEAALTGYLSPRGDFDLRPFAEPLEGPTAAALSALAARHRLALAGPLIERAGGRCFNSLLLFDQRGRRVGHWRKRHPWLPERWAAPGDLGTPVVSLEGRKITAGICYDLHFLAEDAPASLEEAELLLFPSVWVEERDSRQELLSSLARRFDLTILNANWGESLPSIPSSQSNSMILDPSGALLARATPSRGAQLVSARLPPPRPER